MTTKYLSRIITAFLVISLGVSCKKDLLNTIPNDRLSTDVFWKTENDAKLAVNAIYPFLDGPNIFSWDGTSDIGHTNQIFQAEALLEQGVFDAQNSRVLTEWTNAYAGIASSNFFLDNVDKVPTTNTALINQWKGEAKTLRAYQYIKLAAFYGDVPLVTSSLNLEQGRALTRTAVAQVWDFVDKELTDAAATLPATITEKGRVTKGAALALKARAALLAGRFQVAADAAKQVIDLNVYNIFPQFARLFSYAAENNVEVILNKEFIKDNYPVNVFGSMAPYSQKNSNNTYVPTKKLVDAYTMSNGKDITDPTSGFDPNNPYVNRDPRLRFSIFVSGDALPDGKVFRPEPNSGTSDAVGNTYLATSTGFVLKKYINNEDYANPTNNGINIILLRFAEVLLTYAEAKIELNQLDQPVFDAINRVRQRSDVNLPAIPRTLTQAQLREVVRRERTNELAFEGLRTWDIRRWKIAEHVMPGPVFGMTYLANGQLNTIKVQAYEKAFDKSRHYLWPIPQRERQLNPNLTQNPGW
jgi:hypothetical protein